MHSLLCDMAVHRRTDSSRFLQDLLGEMGDVTVAWDDDPEPLPDLATFDLVVFFQALPPPEVLVASRHPNLVWVPMWDAIADVPVAAYKPYRLARLRALCFSAAAEARLANAGLRSLGARYYPPVQGPRSWGTGGLRVFFWQRRAEPGFRTLEALLGPVRPAEVVWLPRLDSGGPPEALETAGWPVRRLDGWLSRADYLSALEGCNLFFAPRRLEGIGMATLEAMARGLCVLGPDAPTTNEYVTHGQTGLLYPPEAPGAVDLLEVATLAAAGQDSVAAGRQRWLERRCEIAAFLRGS